MLLAVEEALGRLAPGELSWLRGRTSVDSKKARMLVGTNEQGTNRVDKERVCMRERLGARGHCSYLCKDAFEQLDWI